MNDLNDYTAPSCNSIDGDLVNVPYLEEVTFACGNGDFNDTDYGQLMKSIPRASLRDGGANTDGSGVLCFPINGDSMEPVLPDGAIVAVNTNDNKIIDGKIYAINQSGWKRIKQLYRTGVNTISIKSINKIRGEEEENIENVDIIGRVFWVTYSSNV